MFFDILKYLFYYFWVKELQGEQTAKGMVEPYTDEGVMSYKQLNSKAVRAYRIAEEYYKQTVAYIDFKNSEESEYYENFQRAEIEKVNTWGI